MALLEVNARFGRELDGKATVEVSFSLAILVPGLVYDRMVPFPEPGGVVADTLTMFAPVPVVYVTLVGTWAGLRPEVAGTSDAEKVPPE